MKTITMCITSIKTEVIKATIRTSNSSIMEDTDIMTISTTEGTEKTMPLNSTMTDISNTMENMETTTIISTTEDTETTITTSTTEDTETKITISTTENMETTTTTMTNNNITTTIETNDKRSI